MKKTVHLSLVPLLLGAILLFSSFSFSYSNGFMSHTTQAYAEDATSGGKTLTFRTSAQASGTFSGRGILVSLPANIQPGDLLIAVAGTNGPKTPWTTPTGWTLGSNSNSVHTQALTWWWKVADGTEGGTNVTFKSNRYADGGIVVNVYEGQTSDPIAGVSQLTTTDNDGNGHVLSAPVAGVTTDATVNAVPLLFVSWQETPTTVTWPDGFGFESSATDGFATVDVAESLSSLLGDTFPGYTLTLNPGQAIVQTLQILVKVQ